MSDKTFGRVVIAVCLVVLLVLALTSCAAIPPPKKAAIPDDLKVICYQGNVAVYKANKAMKLRGLLGE